MFLQIFPISAFSSDTQTLMIVSNILRQIEQRTRNNPTGFQQLFPGTLIHSDAAGVYILENTLSPWGGGKKKYQPMSFWGKKYEKVKRKRGKM